MIEKMFDMENKEELFKYLNSLNIDKEFEELMHNNIQEQDNKWFEQITNQLKQFGKLELYKWLFTSSIHPSNIKYIHRYELLLHILLNIPEKKFFNKKLDRNKFEHFIQWFEKKFSSYFYMIEDWEPFNQLKLIPIFFKGEKFHFFYGSLERPYEFYKQLQEILFLKRIDELEDYKNEYINSLSFQTQILKKLNFVLGRKEFGQRAHSHLAT